MAVYGMLARTVVGAGSVTPVYEATAVTITSVIKITNQSSASAVVKIHVLDVSQTTTDTSTVVHIESVPSMQTVEIKGIVLNSGQKIYVESDQDVNVAVFGYTRTT